MDTKETKRNTIVFFLAKMLCSRKGRYHRCTNCTRLGAGFSALYEADHMQRTKAQTLLSIVFILYCYVKKTVRYLKYNDNNNNNIDNNNNNVEKELKSWTSDLVF